MINVFDDQYFMKQALKEAQKAFDEDEVPVGAVLVWKNQIIARGYNNVEKLTDVTAHAEMIVITAGANYIGGKFLENCTLYVTLEPCSMCAGALYWSRVGKIVYGASDDKRGFMRYGKSFIHPKTELAYGVLEKECKEILKDFFAKKRG